MKEEIEAAARFLTQLVSQNQPANISSAQLEKFRSHLIRLFEERYHNHWFPERPQQGQGYRCIRLNSYSCPDPLIHKAAVDTGLEYGDLKLPVEFTLWVDPQEVSCRFGEHEGSYCTVASFDTDGSMTATASNVKTNNIMTPLQVSIATDHNPLHESATASHAWSNQGHHQRSPSRSSSSSSSGSISHRSKLSPASSSSSLASLSPPIRSTQPHQYRACFYPNYEPQKSWYAYSSLSPPLALTAAPTYHHHHHHHQHAAAAAAAVAAKSRSSPYSGWGLAYVPTTVRYLTNSWPAMGPMVKV